MNFLKNKRCYLAGPIQHGLESNWREEPKKVFVNELGIDLFDPFCDEKQQWVSTLNDAQKNKDYKTIVSVTKSFVRKDLGIVDRADFVIAYLPYRVPTTGTVHEIINSNNSKKPTLLVTDREDITFIPMWYFGFIKLEFMFAGWNSLFNYLREVNDGKHQCNNRWDFVYNKV